MATAVVVGVGLFAPSVASASGHHSGAAPSVTTRYAVTKNVCADAKPGYASCDSIRRVPAAKSAPGALAYSTPSALPLGPAGGFTPGDLSTAYDVNSAASVTGQIVGIVDAYNDPNARADLNHFDANYGLPAETASSLQIVGQTGSAASLPANDTSGWSIEESLDLDAVRGVCHKCKIILVETNTNGNDNLATGVKAAVSLGATEVSNSYGSEEAGDAAAEANAYNYPGVVITASTGDHGWNDWDYINENFYSGDAPEVPASVPNVVSVGGTSLYLNADGSRNDETVWNHNGASDSTGWADEYAEGAGGGGCSTQYLADGWQDHVANYGATGCGTARLSADVSAIADPYTGYDIYDSFNGGEGVPLWATYGGTSLASPVIAALWALAGGSGGVAYPSLSLYGHFSSASSPFFDVTEGGNAYCGGASTADCSADGPLGADPNADGFHNVDCAYPSYLTSDTTPFTNNNACNAAVGYDGPSGVGAPEGLTGFKAMFPTASIKKPTVLALHKAAAFSATGLSDPFPGGSVNSEKWTWGDGSTGHGATAHHTYTKAGTYTVKLVATDNYGSVASASASVTVGKKPSVTVKAPSSLKAHKAGKFKAHASDSNTGGSIKSYNWSWGDHSSSTGAHARHAFNKAGTYHVKLVVTDNTGLKTKKKITVKVH